MTEAYVIHITKECNCACMYCYEDDKTSTYTWDEIRTYLDHLVENAQGSFHIEFLGGEPMMRFDLIEKAVAHVGSTAWKYTITTNGTILEDEHIAWLANHPEVSFAISVDGPGIVNMFRLTKTGKSTWPIVLKNVGRLLKAGVRPSAHIVSHPYNVAYLAQSLHYMYEVGFRGVGVGIVERKIKIDRAFCERYVSELDLVSQAIVDGKYPDFHISELSELKPVTDQRTYLRDSSGKMVGESYGRVEGDITSTDVYKVQKVGGGPNGATEMIHEIRRRVYDIHQTRLGEQ